MPLIGIWTPSKLWPHSIKDAALIRYTTGPVGAVPKKGFDDHKTWRTEDRPEFGSKAGELFSADKQHHEEDDTSHESDPAVEETTP